MDVHVINCHNKFQRRSNCCYIISIFMTLIRYATQKIREDDTNEYIIHAGIAVFIHSYLHTKPGTECPTHTMVGGPVHT